jgi:hypothetical protein
MRTGSIDRHSNIVCIVSAFAGQLMSRPIFLTLSAYFAGPQSVCPRTSTHLWRAFFANPVNFFPGKPTKRPDEQNLQEKSYVETFFGQCNRYDGAGHHQRIRPHLHEFS